MGRRILWRSGNVSILVMVRELGLVVVCAEAWLAKCGSAKLAMAAAGGSMAAGSHWRRVSLWGIVVRRDLGRWFLGVKLV